MSSPAPVVLISGAAGSLGQAVTRVFLEHGARCLLLDRHERSLRQVYPQAEEQDLWTRGVDLLDRAATGVAVEAALHRYGRIDAVCHLAGGFAMGSPVHATLPADWDAMWDINVRTLVHLCEAVVPSLLRQGAGRIVTVGAGAARQGLAQMGAYCAAKSAVIRLTESMSAELREQGINVNCVLPSIIDTPANRAAMPEADPGRWVAPADLARVIHFLCSDAARALHGVALPVTHLS